MTNTTDYYVHGRSIDGTVYYVHGSWSGDKADASRLTLDEANAVIAERRTRNRQCDADSIIGRPYNIAPIDATGTPALAGVAPMTRYHPRYHLALLDDNAKPIPQHNYPTWTAEEVAELFELTPEDVEWAVEGYGRCDSDRYVAWEAGTPAPTKPWKL